MSTAISRGLGDRVAVGAGADRRERHRRGADLVGDLEAAAVAAREEAGLAGVAALPDRPDGVDHEAGGELEARGGLGVAEGAAAEARGTPRAARGPAARWMAPSTPPPPSSDGVGGVDDGVDVLGGDVAERDLEVGAHESQRRFADRGAAGAESPHTGLSPGPGRRWRIMPTRGRNPLRSGPRPSIVTPL